jgi:hypothetical protein
MTHDAELQALLDAAGVSWRRLSDAERVEAEAQWLAVYTQAFRGRQRHGSRADYEYALRPAGRWLIVPLTSEVEGTQVTPVELTLGGYDCEGPVVPLGLRVRGRIHCVASRPVVGHAVHARGPRPRRPVLRPAGMAGHEPGRNRRRTGPPDFVTQRRQPTRRS